MIEAPPTVSVQPLGTQISLGAQMQLASFALGREAQSVFVMQGASSQVPALQRPGDPPKSQAVPLVAAGLSHRPVHGIAGFGGARIAVVTVDPGAQYAAADAASVNLAVADWRMQTRALSSTVKLGRIPLPLTRLVGRNRT